MRAANRFPRRGPACREDDPAVTFALRVGVARRTERGSTAGQMTGACRTLFGCLWLLTLWQAAATARRQPAGPCAGTEKVLYDSGVKERHRGPEAPTKVAEAAVGSGACDAVGGATLAD